MSGSSKLGFFFEFGSTYSYLSAARIEALAADFRAVEDEVEVSWEPFLLGPIFASQGWNDSPFNIYKAKGRYMWRDIKRRCEEEKVSFNKPSIFPRNSLLATRVAFLAKSESWMPEFSKAVFQANFVEDKDISDERVIRDILDSLGEFGEALIKASQSPENKRGLREQTNRAIELGIFGAPSFVAEDSELFWGDDRLEDAVEFLVSKREIEVRP